MPNQIQEFSNLSANFAAAARRTDGWRLSGCLGIFNFLLLSLRILFLLVALRLQR